MRDFVGKTEFKKEAGMLYSVSSGEDGFLCIYKTKAGRPRKEIAGMEVPDVEAEIEEALPEIPAGVG